MIYVAESSGARETQKATRRLIRNHIVHGIALVVTLTVFCIGYECCCRIPLPFEDHGLMFKYSSSTL